MCNYILAAYTYYMDISVLTDEQLQQYNDKIAAELQARGTNIMSKLYDTRLSKNEEKNEFLRQYNIALKLINDKISSICKCDIILKYDTSCSREDDYHWKYMCV